MMNYNRFNFVQTEKLHSVESVVNFILRKHLRIIPCNKIVRFINTRRIL